jgi:23S rRNA (adenine2030-N6)-methyltransferase
VFKHVVLCALLAALSRKDKPWCYVETHAGAGAYDLQGEGATRTGEWRDGIGRLWGLDRVPDVLQTFLDVVRGVNGTGALRHYPGSPLFAQALARERDRLVLCEKVPEIAAELRENLKGERRAVVHHRDGHEAHALLPPAEKRGLVLIDPPFERPDEFAAAAELVGKSIKRFAAGVYAVWYPLKNRHAAARFERQVARACDEPPLRIALENGAPGEGQMRGCAVLVVNPPFGLERGLEASGKLLAQLLAQGPRPLYEARAVSGVAA